MARIGYLIDHVLALNTRTRMLLGEKFPFNEMAKKLYDLTAPEYDYRKFGRIVEELNQALPGSGSGREKILEFRRRISIPGDRLLEVMTKTTQEFHDMSMDRMTLTGNSIPRVRVRRLPSRTWPFVHPVWLRLQSFGV